MDTTGSLTLPSGTPLSFKDAVELVSKLAKLPEVQHCMTTQWMRYMLGRREVDGRGAVAGGGARTCSRSPTTTCGSCWSG